MPTCSACSKTQLPETVSCSRGSRTNKSLHRYAPDKWSIREVVSHINDTERVFVFRACGSPAASSRRLPSFDQDVATGGAYADERPWRQHIDEFRAVRAASLRVLQASARRRVDASWRLRAAIRSRCARSRTSRPGTSAHHMRILLRERYLYARAVARRDTADRPPVSRRATASPNAVAIAGPGEPLTYAESGSVGRGARGRAPVDRSDGSGAASASAPGTRSSTCSRCSRRTRPARCGCRSTRRTARADLDRMIAATRPTLIIADESSARSLHADRRASRSWRRRAFAGRGVDRAFGGLIADWHGRRPTVVDRADDGDAQIIKFSGGSTGAPKPVVQSVRCVNAQVDGILGVLRARRGRRQSHRRAAHARGVVLRAADPRRGWTGTCWSRIRSRLACSTLSSRTA